MLHPVECRGCCCCYGRVGCRLLVHITSSIPLDIVPVRMEERATETETETEKEGDRGRQRMKVIIIIINDEDENDDGSYLFSLSALISLLKQWEQETSNRE
ncbi:hypothetical protein I4U23_021602 [Adineta vaga]|nr:hypothetical protein I4U23_021602 [Adineta vaga]